MGEEHMTFREATIKYIKDVLRPRTIYEVIDKELQDAYLRKLEAETAAEYADAAIKYNSRRIERLRQRLFEHAGDDE
jgi:regulator of sirC expression with transglutaminase-like and TPR domain